MGSNPHTPLSEQESLTLAIRYEAAYREDPIDTTHFLIGQYGSHNYNRIVGWIEATKFNCTIDESAGLAEDFDPKETA